MMRPRLIFAYLCVTSVHLFQVGACLAGPAPYDVPLEAVLGDKVSFQQWRKEFRPVYTARIDSIKNLAPASSRIIKEEINDGVKLLTISFDYTESSPLSGKEGGGILAIPPVIDASKPIAIAIHGHEHSPWAKYPTGLFAEHKWPWSLVKAGYIVWAPVSMYHKEIEQLGKIHSYLPVWVKIASEGMDHLAPRYFSKLPHADYAVLGVSGGGLTAYSLMAYRTDIKAGVFAGSEQPLDFLRREYHLKNHPNCWDFPGIASYTAIQALIAPRAIQFQMGRTDPWFPSGEPFPKKGDWFPGTSRDVISDEIGGHILILRSLWELLDGDVSYDLHEGGHAMDPTSAIEFLESVAPAIEASTSE